MSTETTKAERYCDQCNFDAYMLLAQRDALQTDHAALAAENKRLREALAGNAELYHKSHWDKDGPPLITFADCNDDRCYVNRAVLAQHDAEEVGS